MDRVAMAEGTVEGDAAAHCLHGLVARVREACRCAEGDTGAPVAEGKVGRVVELQRAVRVRPVPPAPEVPTDATVTFSVLVPMSSRILRSEERRVGKEGRSRWSPY